MEQNPYPLQRKWVIWELWNPIRETSEGTNMAKVGEFDGLHEFWQHWNYLPHAMPSLLFENPETRSRTIVESLNRAIEGIGLFESDMEPTWEDAVNKLGSDFSFELDNSDSKVVKEVWDKIVFSLIGETMPYCEDATGAWVIDRRDCVKFEVWFRFDGKAKSSVNKTTQIKEHFQKILGVSDVHIASHSSY